MADNNPISVSDLKQLLFEVYEVRPDTRIKVRLGNEPWTNNFLSIIHLAGLTNEPPDFQGIIFNDEALQRLVIVKNLNEIRQFMLDKSYPGFKRNVEYSVKHEVSNVE
jgi:hypothetical protein